MSIKIYNWPTSFDIHDAIADEFHINRVLSNYFIKSKTYIKKGKVRQRIFGATIFEWEGELSDGEHRVHYNMVHWSYNPEKESFEIIPTIGGEDEFKNPKFALIHLQCEFGEDKILEIKQ